MTRRTRAAAANPAEQSESRPHATAIGHAPVTEPGRGCSSFFDARIGFRVGDCPGADVLDVLADLLVEAAYREKG